MDRLVHGKEERFTRVQVRPTEALTYVGLHHWAVSVGNKPDRTIELQSRQIHSSGLECRSIRKSNMHYRSYPGISLQNETKRSSSEERETKTNTASAWDGTGRARLHPAEAESRLSRFLARGLREVARPQVVRAVRTRRDAREVRAHVYYATKVTFINS